MSYKSFSIIVTSDLHGEYTRFETIAQHIRQKKPQLLIDNGDLLQGSMEHFYDNAHHASSHMIALANELEYDVMVYGNHEFNEPAERLAQLEAQANFPWISCNIEGKLAHIVKEINGLTVLIIGATTQFTPLWDEHRHIQQMQFFSAYDSIQQQLPNLQQRYQPDFTIVSYHGGFAKDPAGAWIFDQDTGENEAEQLLTLSGIDLLITGHQHMQLTGQQNGITYIQPGSHGYCYGEIIVNATAQGWHITPTIHMLEQAAPRQPAVQQWLQQPIGTVATNLQYDGLLNVMLHGHPYVEWFHAFQRAVTGAQISVTELFFSERGGFPEHVVRQHIYENYGRDNVLVTLEMTGQAICEAIEQSAAVLAVHPHGEIDYAVNVYPGTLQPYQFDFFGGVHFTCDYSQPVGQRIQDIYVGQQRLKSQALYTVAVNSFRAMGHAPYTMYTAAHELRRTSQTIPELLIQAIQQHRRQ